MKKILLITLIISSIFFFGCSNSNDSENMVKLNKIDISALNNRKIKNIIDDTSLEEGVYQINTSSNTYIYFLGFKHIENKLFLKEILKSFAIFFTLDLSSSSFNKILIFASLKLILFFCLFLS